MLRGAFLFAIAGLLSLAVHAESKPGATKQAPRFGNWEVVETVDKMTDRKECFIGHAKLPYLFTNGSGEVLRISFRGRGGVGSYRVRLDKQPPSDLRIANETEKATSVIAVRLFEDEVGDVGRVIVEGTTLLGAPIDEDISLSGLKAARTELKRRCG